MFKFTITFQHDNGEQFDVVGAGANKSAVIFRLTNELAAAGVIGVTAVRTVEHSLI
ncbi:hypothetical protein ACVBR5_000903 [Burkholderia cenocepacia]